MRPTIPVAAAVSLVFGCAPQAVTTAALQPESQGLTVRMFEPAGGALRYSLSEPAYVAAFAVTPGAGIKVVVPAREAATDQPRKAGFNRESMVGGARPLPLANSRKAARGTGKRLDGFYLIASRYPLPVEEMLQAADADVAAATTLHEALDALAAALTKGVPAEAWDADAFVYPLNPSTSGARRLDRVYNSCADRWIYNRATLITSLPCEFRTRGTRLQ